jgi:hypothetical protein
MLISYDFLLKSEIESMRTEMKKTPNMDGVPETSSKIHLGPSSLKITSFIQFRSLKNFKKSVFIYKFICFIFQSKVREMRRISVAKF